MAWSISLSLGWVFVKNNFLLKKTKMNWKSFKWKKKKKKVNQVPSFVCLFLSPKPPSNNPQHKKEKYYEKKAFK